jgi:hypothetical protein
MDEQLRADVLTATSIDYVATDQSGLSSTSTRIVLIQPPAAPSIVPTDEASSTTDTTSTATATDK